MSSSWCGDLQQIELGRVRLILDLGLKLCPKLKEFDKKLCREEAMAAKYILLF